MVDCERCGYTHAPGYCPVAGGVTPMPRATPSPTYAVAMQYLEARTLPTSGAGNLCLFYALDGDIGAGGRLEDGHGTAVSSVDCGASVHRL